MSLLPWLALALASVPDKTARLYEVVDGGSGTDRIGNMAVSGRLVTGRTANTGVGFVLDTDTWRMATYDGCSVVGAGVDDLETVWFGCADGTIVPQQYYRGALYDLVDTDGAAIRPQATLSSGHEAVAFWVDPDVLQAFLFTYSEADSLVEAFAYDVFSASAEGPGTAISSIPASGWDESELVYRNPVTGPAVMITFNGNQHGQFTYNVVDDTVATAQFVNIVAQGGEKCTDWNDSFFALYCLDAQRNQLLQYVGGVSQFPFTALATLGPFDEPKAVTVSDIEGDSWLAVTGGQVQVWELDDNGAVQNPDKPAFEGDPGNDNEIQDGVTARSVLFGGGINGNLHVSMAQPWMRNGPTASYTNQGEEAAGTGDSVELTFTWDEAVAWTAYRGGNPDEPGDVITTGTAEQDATTSIEVVVDSDWDEGENDIFILGESLEDGLMGHGWLGVDVDNPPKRPNLAQGNVDFGDQRLVISFDGIPDVDLAYYELYVSTEAFTAEEWPTGGPDLGAEPVPEPVRIEVAPSTRVTYEIGPLTNGTTYYMAVRAYDAGGKEGAMSNVVSGAPVKGYGAADLAGETGGSTCATGAGAASGSLALLLAALVGRRRRGVAAAGIVALATGLSAPSSASAADDGDHWWKADLTPARGNFEVRYGGFSSEDQYINRVYDTKPKNMLSAEFGPQLWRVFEMDLQLGFFQELDKTRQGRSANAARSDDRTMLTWFQFGIDATARLHILDEQPVVPFARYGWDYVQWNENKVTFGGEEVTRGGKPGQHYAVGANLLLDLIQPGRASLLEARTGINDTWLTIEWRRQRIDSRSRPWEAPDESGLIFSGDIFQVGLKLDY